MKGEVSIKISKKGKEFIERIQANRVILRLPKLTQVETIELISNYFENNNESYIEMVRGGVKNV